MSAFLTDTPFEKSKAPAVHDIEFQNQQIIGEHDVLACIEGPRPPGSRAAMPGSLAVRSIGCPLTDQLPILPPTAAIGRSAPRRGSR
jgi:hypothetical protein